jgi:hypothetical protein
MKKLKIDAYNYYLLCAVQMHFLARMHKKTNWVLKFHASLQKYVYIYILHI